MAEKKRITTPLSAEVVRDLKAGDSVLITGIVYSARDAAHKVMTETLARGEKLPVDLTNQVVYYLGPTPAKPGAVIGSAGPTTSGRMDAYAPTLLEQGLRGMIGKGSRSKEVVESMKKNGAGELVSLTDCRAVPAGHIECVPPFIELMLDQIGAKASGL